MADPEQIASHLGMLEMVFVLVGAVAVLARDDDRALALYKSGYNAPLFTSTMVNKIAF